MKAKKILDKLNYVPRWLLYTISFFVAFPWGILAMYLAIHALEHKAKLEAEEDRAAQASARASTGVRRGDGYEVRNAEPAPKPAAAKKTGWHALDNYEPIDPDAGLEEVLRKGRALMGHIRQANDAIPDPVLTAKIDSIEGSCKQILSMLEQRPELLPQLRTFLRYYLPTTMKLLDARARLDEAETPKGREVRQRIGNALSEVEKAFRTQVSSLEEYSFVDLESEMDVLSQMLHADGLVEEDDMELHPKTENRRQTMGGH